MAYIGKFREGWRVQVQKDGIRLSKTFPTKRECQAWATAQESKKTLAATHTLRQACDKYLKTVTPQKRNAQDWESHRMDMFCLYFGDGTPLVEIDSAAIGHLRDFRLSGGILNGVEWSSVSGSTVNREFTLLRHMLKLAHEEWKWIEEYPFKGVRMPKENPSRTKIWRWQQIRRVLRDGARRGGKTAEVVKAFHIALRTSLRLQEALAAPAGYDSKRKTITIPPNKVEALPEIVPTTSAARRLLATMPRLGVGPNEASVLFSELCRQMGIKGLEFKDSRATALTHMAKRMEMVTLQKFSRHKDIRKLTIYYRETAEEISARF